MPKYRSTPATAAIESLEPRQLLAAQVVEGELQVIGTHLSDRIRVYVDPRTPDQLAVVINSTTEKFPIATIQSINVQAGQGNDRVQVEGSSPRYNFPSRIYGSGGNDTIFGGYGIDRIYGGSGHDSIFGSLSKDIIYGEAGNDTIDGDAGNDYISGGDGNDSLTGWTGIDYLYGDGGDDYIDSQDGATDRVDGGTGSDRAFADTILDRTFVSIETFIL